MGSNKDDKIILVGVRVNNLKNINLKIPKQKIVVFTGVSGSGKSSLAFDTIAVESSRQLNLTYPLYLRNRMQRFERPAADEIKNLTPAILINQQVLGGGIRSTVGSVTDIAPLIRLLFSRIAVPNVGSASSYSFNHPLGMCLACRGMGKKLSLDIDKLLDKNKSLNENAILFSQFSSSSWQWKLYTNSGLFNNDKKLSEYNEQEWNHLLYGIPERRKVNFLSNNTGKLVEIEYEGLVSRFNRLYLNRDISKLKRSTQQEIISMLTEDSCPDCNGIGLSSKILTSKIGNLNIVDYFNMQMSDLLPILLDIQHPVGRTIALQAADCVERMIHAGLGYLTLSRRTDTLSGGEGQRLKIVSCLGSSLNNITYILDEPSVGLHPKDIEKLKNMLIELRDRHNTVLVVEHDRDIISLADEVIDMGPLAGSDGGEVVFQGPVKELLKTDTLTAKMLRQTPQVNPSPRKWDDIYTVENATLYNLKGITVSVPKNVLTVVTGVSGSGKSTLICKEFTAQNPNTILITQKPISASSRSTPATYTGVMDIIRDLFATANGVDAGIFSFNSIGACPICKGKGEIIPDVAFADPITVQCEDCGGSRYSHEALEYCYNGKNIVEILSLTISQAKSFFSNEKISSRLQVLQEVGLGYLTLGQPTNTLSGGENQRLKLASELHKSGNIYILDEPTTGLHMADVHQLVTLLQGFVNRKNTIIVVEHNLDIIAQADWIIDLGLNGGDDGGNIQFIGTPQDMLKVRNSYTAEYLKKAILRANSK